MDGFATRSELAKAWMIWLAICGSQNACSEIAENGLTIDLQGRHRFQLGDDPRWAKVELDDSAWPSINVPGGWMSQGHERYPRRGWYRIHFDWPAKEEPPAAQALILGPVRSSFEVYLNGQMIGSSGGVNRGNIWSQLPRSRVVRIPREQIRVGDNLLAIRILRLVVDGGVRRGLFGIGDADELIRAEQVRLRPVLLWETVFLVFYSSSLLFSLMLYGLGYRELKHTVFMIMLAHIGLSHLTQGELLGALGFESAFTRRVSTALDQFFPMTTLFFLKTVLAIRLSKWEKGSLLFYALLCLSWWLNEWTIDNLYFPWVLYSIVVFGCLSIHWCVRAFWKKQGDATPLLMGVIGFVVVNWSMLVPSLRASLFGSGEHHGPFYVPNEWFAWLWIHLCMMFMLASGYVRQRRELERATHRILEAQETERSRLSRDLHDSVGQSILAMKLELETMKTTKNDAEVFSGLDSLIGAADELLTDVRIVSANLRPAILDRSGLVAAIKALTESIQRTTEIRIRVNANGESNLARATEGHLYRFVQEAISNSIRHGKAKTIEVSVEVKTNEIQITITDDGLGFDVKRSKDGNGLTNMRDRAQLLGGCFILHSTPGKETTVTIEVPNAC